MTANVRALLAMFLALAVQVDASAEQERLRPGVEATGTLGGSGTAGYLIALNANEVLEVQVTQSHVDVRLRLVDPSGQELMRSNLRRPQQGPEQLLAIASAPGDHQLIVENAGTSAADATFAIAVMAVRAADDRDRTLAGAADAYGRGESESSRGGGDALRAALVSFRQAADRWQAAAAPFERATALNRIGAMEMQLSNLSEALAAHDEALRLRREIGDRYGEGVSLNNLAAIYMRQGNYQRAGPLYDEAIQVRRAVGDANGEGWSLIGASVIHGLRNSGWVTAIAGFREALGLMEKTNDERGVAEAHYYLGLGHARLREFDQAAFFFDKALAVRTRQKDLAGQASVLTQLAALQLEVGDPQRALEFLERALPLRRAAGDRRGEGYTLQTIGVAHNRRGDRARALEHLRAALQIFEAVGDREGHSGALIHLAGTHAAEGQHQLAIDLTLQARAVMKGAPTLLTALLPSVAGDAQLALGRHDEAAASYTEALTESRRLGETMPAARAQAGLGRVLHARGDLAAARERLLAALDQVESVRAGVAQSEIRATFLANSQSMYDSAIEILVDLHRRDGLAGYAAEALAVSERRRARSLLEVLVEAHTVIRTGADAALLEREERTQQQLNVLSLKRAMLQETGGDPAAEAPLTREISDLVADLRTIRGDLSVRNPNYADLMSPLSLDLARIQQLLDRDTVLLEYSLGEKHSYLWAITPSGMTLHVLPARKVIENVVARGRELITDSARRAVRAPLRQALNEMGQMILGPVARELDRKRLVIVPDGVLQYLPFAVLPHPGRGGTSTADQPLMVTHEIVTLPSASALEILRATRRPVRSSKVAVLADPVLQSGDPRIEVKGVTRIDSPTLPRDLVRAGEPLGPSPFERLPFSRDEAVAIAARAGRTQSLTALGFDATRELALSPTLSEYRIVHFATHAVLDTRHPELSGIVLSMFDRQGQPLNGFVRLHEIFKLRLSADLIVLSGCQTALGQDVRGEGLIGLTRGFMYAGASQVVASLWNVRDRATATFMDRFYRALLERDQSPAAALRSAQLSMWKDPQWRMPAYWAGFIVQGDWQSLPPGAR